MLGRLLRMAQVPELSRNTTRYRRRSSHRSEAWCSRSGCTSHCSCATTTMSFRDTASLVTLDFTKLGRSFTFKFARAFNPAISFAPKYRSCSSDLQRQNTRKKKKVPEKISFSQLRSSATNTRNPALAGYWMKIQNRASFDPGSLPKNRRLVAGVIPEMTPANRVHTFIERTGFSWDQFKPWTLGRLQYNPQVQFLLS